MNKTRRVCVALLSVLISVTTLASVVAYAKLPDQFISHWNISGEADGAIPKAVGAFLLPVFMLIVLALYVALSRVGMVKTGQEHFGSSSGMICLSIVAFLAYVHVLMLAFNLGERFDFARWLIPAYAGFWYLLGMSLVGIKRNRFMGIRTPWTLADDVVWEKTHRFGARLFKATAATALLGWFWPACAVWAILCSACTAALGSIIYSYVIRHRPNVSEKK